MKINNKQCCLNLFGILVQAMLAASCIQVDGLKVYVDDGNPLDSSQQAVSSSDSLLLTLDTFEETVEIDYQACGEIKATREKSSASYTVFINELTGKEFVEQTESGDSVLWRFSTGAVVALDNVSELVVEKASVSESTSEQSTWVTVAGPGYSSEEAKSYFTKRMIISQDWEGRRVVTWVLQDSLGDQKCQYLAVDLNDKSRPLVGELVTRTSLPRESRALETFIKAQSWKELWPNEGL